MKVSQILEKAFALLGPHGERWQRGNPSRGFCASTAISKTTDKWHSPMDLFAKANGITIDRLTCCNIWRWNDSPDRTFPEVKAAFQKAIALARQEESLDAPGKEWLAKINSRLD